jgi:hypothetical protein
MKLRRVVDPHPCPIRGYRLDFPNAAYVVKNYYTGLVAEDTHPFSLSTDHDS